MAATAHDRRRVRSPAHRKTVECGRTLLRNFSYLDGGERFSSQLLGDLTVDPFTGCSAAFIANCIQRDFEMTQNIHQPRPSILRLRTVLERTGLSRSTIYALMRTGEFPRQIALAPRSVGWLESDVEAWISARVALTRR